MQKYSAPEVLERTNRYNENDGVSKRVHELRLAFGHDCHLSPRRFWRRETQLAALDSKSDSDSNSAHRVTSIMGFGIRVI